MKNFLNSFRLKTLLIHPNKFKDKRYLLFLCLAFILFVCISIKEGLKVGIGGDFNVFWTSGKNFFLHNDLYSQIGGAKRYIYPPFAAMLFQFLAIFPMNVAASMLSFINLLLFLFSIYLTRSIFELDRKSVV